jgi:hypothetical protein
MLNRGYPPTIKKQFLWIDFTCMENSTYYFSRDLRISFSVYFEFWLWYFSFVYNLIFCLHIMLSLSS